MLLLFILVLPCYSQGIECIPPAVNEHVGEELSANDDPRIYTPGYNKSYKCMGETVPLQSYGDITMNRYSITCQNDGTWNKDPLICGKNIAHLLPLKTKDGYCQPHCKPSTEWEINLLDPADIEGVKVVFELDSSNLDSSWTLDIFSSTSRSTSCFIPPNPTGENFRFAQCPFSEAETIKITSSKPILVTEVIAISLNSVILSRSEKFYFYDSNVVGDSFILSDYKKTYAEAREACFSVGAGLVDIASEKEWDAIRWGLEVKTAIDAQSHGSTMKFFREARWIGLSVQRGIWRWESGTPLTVHQSQNFTSKPTPGLAVVLADKDWRWKTVRQVEENKFICRIRKQKRGKLACPYPGSPEGGYIKHTKSGKFWWHIEEVTYTCIEGYDLVGEETRKCDHQKGEYATPIPRCAPR